MKQTYNYVSPAFQLVIPPLPRTLRLAFLSTAVFVYCSVLLITLGLHRTSPPWYQPANEYTAAQPVAIGADTAAGRQAEDVRPLAFPENKTIVRRVTASVIAGTVLGLQDVALPVNASRNDRSTTTGCGCGQAGSVSADLASRARGRILLQVEEQGEAWYIEPVSSRAYYLADGTSALRVLSRFAVGITDADISQIPVGDASRLGAVDIPGNVELVNRLKGRILLQVESKGEAWYVNPSDGKRYYLANGEAAYQVMRYLSLGITNQDLRQIGVGETEGN